MPYIDKQTRQYLTNPLDLGPQTSGELNYMITKLCVDFLPTGDDLSYAHINTVIGVLECAKQEFYRRVAVPYEEQKRHDNGDVY